MYLGDDRVEHRAPEEVAGDGYFPINEAYRGIIWILDVETCKVEHLVCNVTVSMEQRMNPNKL